MRIEPSEQEQKLLACVMMGANEKAVTLIKEAIPSKETLSMLLCWASYYSKMDFVKLFLDYGADPKIKNSEPLRVAVQAGATDIVNLLLPLSDPDEINSKGESAKTMAELTRNEEITQLIEKWEKMKVEYDVLKEELPLTPVVEKNRQRL